MNFKKNYLLFIIIIFVLTTGNILSAEEKGIHQRVNELMLAQKFDEAEKLALSEYKKHPDDPETICALACVYRNKAVDIGVIFNTSAMGIKDGESGLFEVKVKEGDIEKYFTQKEILFRDIFAKGEKLYYEIIEKDPLYENAYFNLLNSYVTLEEFDNYFKVIDLYIKNKEKKKSIDHTLNDLAGKLYNGKFYDHAIRLYKIIIEKYSENTHALSDLGTVYIHKGEINQAFVLYRKVYKKDPDDLINLNNYKIASILKEDFNTAYNLVNALASKETEKYYHLYDAGVLACLLGKDYEKHFKDYLKRSEKDVKEPDKDFWTVYANGFLEMSSMEKAEKIDFLESHLNTLNNNNYDELAIVTANIINKIEPTNFSIVITGGIYDRYMYVEKMIKYLNLVKERKKIDNSVMPDKALNYNFGRAYFLKEEYDTALEYFIKNLNEKKDDASLNFVIGKCYLGMGNKEEAKKYFTINKKLNDKEQMEYINYSIQELNKIEAK